VARRGRRVAVIVVVVALLGGGAYWGLHSLWKKAKDVLAYPHCSFTIGTGQDATSTDIDTDQASVAATLVGVVSTRELPDHAAFLLLMAAWQESGLRNLPGGDRDSVGVLQQRPSQGWGTVDQLSDLHYAASKFLEALLKHDDWKTADPAAAIDAVQISASTEAYNQHKAEAQVLAEVLLGNVPAGLTCEFDPPTVVATPAAVIEQLQTDLPVNPPRAVGSTVTVPGAGWQTAMWFVANADRLGIDRVSYAKRTWSRAAQWTDDPAASTASVTAALAVLKK